jgi:purine nucleoside phosphorylase
MSKITCAFIGGTGMGTLFQEMGFTAGDPCLMKTVYGDAWYTIIRRDDLAFVSIDRHHSTGGYRLADQLDHRPYMYGLWKLNQLDPGLFDIQFIFTVSAVGGLHDARNIAGGLEVGDIVIPHDVIDFTRGAWTFSIRDKYVHPWTFHRSAQGLFCPCLEMLLWQNTQIKSGGVLACAVTGPLFETPAEIVMHARQGICDLFGMQTVTPEAYYARQMGMHLAVACVVTDTPDVEHDVDGVEVVRVMNERKPLLADLFVSAMLSAQDMIGLTCSCVKHLPVFHKDLAGDPADVLGFPGNANLQADLYRET